MKKLHKAFLIAALATSALALMACSDDDDDDSSSSSVSASLPKSVGTNEVGGKKFTLTEDESTSTWEFSDSTVKLTETSSDGTWIGNYKYTYDQNKGILSFGYISEVDNGITISSVSDYVKKEKQKLEAKGKTWTDTRLEYYTAEGTAAYNTPLVFKYELNGSMLKLTPNYFSGTLPARGKFKVSTNSRCITLGEGEGGRIKIEDIDNSSDTRYYGYPTYSNGSFSGTLYEGHGEKSVGTIAGTYTTSGTGTSGSTVTLTFTTIPSELTGLEKDKAYTLNQVSYEDKVYLYTLVE